ncbi:MAG: hypothetical protein IPJ68_05520 [Candidatus Moraniibacteriota bacterium]|nr:MAG: hypothetical protein IPJ68_05520 [Candidatus Moranbacteria bacterium]
MNDHKASFMTQALALFDKYAKHPLSDRCWYIRPRRDLQKGRHIGDGSRETFERSLSAVEPEDIVSLYAPLSPCRSAIHYIWINLGKTFIPAFEVYLDSGETKWFLYPKFNNIEEERFFLQMWSNFEASHKHEAVEKYGCTLEGFLKMQGVKKLEDLW